MGTSVSSAFMARIRTIFVACATFALALDLAPATSFAADAPMLASSLLGGSTAIVSEDVELVAVDDDGVDAAIDPVIGSFTVDGLTFALSDDGVTLVSVSPDAMRASGPDGGRGEVAPEGTSFASAPSELSAPSGPLVIPANVSYDGVTYDVTAIGPYAFYLSGATQVELPASITSVDDRAFRSSDVERVEVDADNPNIASFDGCLYDSQLLSLLLIPEGRAGAVLLPETAEEVQPSKFSHCSLVDAISVEEGGAAFASWEGLLYDASGTTLLRVPAGATDITIREGCTTIAAGAMEGCAKLERINAPATVTSISSYAFCEEPETIVVPATVFAEGCVHISSVVALTSIDDSLAQVDLASIKVFLPAGSDVAAWDGAGFSWCESDYMMPAATTQNAATYAAVSLYVNANGGVLEPGSTNCSGDVAVLSLSSLRAWNMYPDDPNIAVAWDSNGVVYERRAYRKGYSFVSWTGTTTLLRGSSSFGTSSTANWNLSGSFTTNWAINTYPITYDLDGGSLDVDNPSAYQVDTPSFILRNPAKGGYFFTGWEGVYTGDSSTGNSRHADGISTVAGQEITIDDPLNAVVATNSETGGRKYTATWKKADFNVSFETSAEPSDENYPSKEKPDETINIADGQVQIEDPQRPGYVFQGWVIPDAATGDKEALDQDLVYQGDDDKWYVDASKLPDYATDGKVELTARWTSIISVDVPNAVTFYADTVTQGQESREGAASSAFGQSKVANQSQVDLRVVGLESSAVETTDSVLGADSILKKSTTATPATSAQKLLSLYPSAKAWTAEELQDPSAVGSDKAATAVDFDLDDLLLEASFAADDFTIPAGDTLNMGYRLNLEETGQLLDYDKLSTLDDGQSAAIANVSYCLAADPLPVFWTTDDDGSLLLTHSIKADAEKIAAGDEKTIAKYTRWMNEGHRFYVRWYDQGKTEAQDAEAATIYEVQILGINHDNKADGSGKAGLTFQLVNCLSNQYRMNATNVVTGVWERSELRARMNPGTQSVASGTDDNAIWNQVPSLLAEAIEPVKKVCWNGANETSSTTLTVNDYLFLPAEVEMRKLATYTNYTYYYSRTLIYEGSLYPCFNNAPNDYVGWSGTMKRLSDTGDYVGYWLRSHSPNPYNSSYAFMCIGADGSSSHVGSASTVYGVSPAFCL